MTTYLQLQGSVAADLADPSNQTFDVNAIKTFIQAGLAEVQRFAPDMFQEDLAPVASQVLYPLRSAIFSTPVPEVRLVRVEVWRGSPSRFAFKITAKAGQPSKTTESGWEVWDGQLELPGWVVDQTINVATDTIRVWGYSPYAPISADADVVPVSADLELAVREFCRVAAMRRLVSSRTLFKQWQVRSNNTDVTLGQLNSDLQVAEEQWRRLSRALKVPEQNPD